MKNQTIRDRYAALTVLSQRTLPTKAMNKVAVLLRTRFQAPFEATEELRKQVLRQHPVPEGWDKPTLPEDVAQRRQDAMDEAMALSTPVRKVPDTLRLTGADMPQPLKADDGANVAGLAQIKVMLGSLYDWSAEERELLDGGTGDELEPDDEPRELTAA